MSEKSSNYGRNLCLLTNSQIDEGIFNLVKNTVDQSEELILSNFSEKYLCTAPLIPSTLCAIDATEFSHYWIMTEEDEKALEEISEGLKSIISSKMTSDNSMDPEDLKGFIKFMIKAMVCESAIDRVNVDKVLNKLDNVGWMDRAGQYLDTGGEINVFRTFTKIYAYVFWGDETKLSGIEKNELIMDAREYFQSVNKEYFIACDNRSSWQYKTCKELIAALLIYSTIREMHVLIDELDEMDRSSAIVSIGLFVNEEDGLADAFVRSRIIEALSGTSPES